MNNDSIFVFYVAICLIVLIYSITEVIRNIRKLRKLTDREELARTLNPFKVIK